MNRYKSPGTLYVILLIIFCIFFYGCFRQAGDLPENINEKETTAKLSGTVTPALVVFYIGHCYVLQNDIWETLGIGQFLAQNDTIKVESDSYLEIKLGDKAIICIEENSEVTIQSLLYEIDKKDIQLYLKKGSVFNSLGKLLPHESFEVITPNVILSVRGTQFLVKEDSRQTHVAVKEGSVALLPPGIYETINSGSNNRQMNRIDELKSTLIGDAPLLNQKKEIVITKEKASLVKETVYSLISFIMDTRETTDNYYEKELFARTRRVTESLNRLKKDIIDVTEETKKHLFSPRYSIPGNKGYDGTGSNHTSMYANPVLIEIEVDADDAVVYMNDTIVGKKRIGALYDKAEKYTFVIKCPGYEDTQFDINSKTGIHYNYTVHLQKDENRIKEIETNNNSGDLPEIDNNSQEPRENSDSGFIAYDKIRHYNISTTSIIGQIEYNDKTIYLADKYGALYGIDENGKKKWTISTNNNPNEHSYPVVLGDKIYFTGSDELVIADKASGTHVKRKSLQADEAHYFGRRIIPYSAGYGIFPANNSLKIMDLKSGEFIRSINCPVEFRTTPVLYKNHIIIVDQKGTVMFINPETGVIRKTFPTQARKPVALPVSIKGNFLYFGDSSGHIVCIDVIRDVLLWERDVMNENTTIYHRLECGENSVNLFAGGILLSLDPENGKERFPPVTGVSAPPLFIQGRLVFGTKEGLLVILNEADGKELVSINVGREITTRPVAADNKLIFGTETGELVIIPLSPGSAL
ncbi:MAG: PQQ-binding-like beta-propeller repeat protein [Spirochaetales bacterium]|nr:PQQ-binding-like beta-propeller repeat protein [Spirochaetales bacterium]